MRARFEQRDTKDTTVFTCPALEETGVVRHAFSTRRGGVSEIGLNLGMHTSDAPANIRENYRIFCDAAGVDDTHLVLSQQVHGDRIATVTRQDCGKGFCRPPEGFEETDGLITAEPGIALATFYADCTPFLMLDPVKRVIASVHSGWRGTLARIGRKAVARFVQDFGSRPEDIMVAVGPAIMQCHFEVDEDVKNLFLQEFGTKIRPYIAEKNQKFYIDTHAVNAQQFQQAGILSSNLYFSGLCTVCQKDLFFSHRGDGGGTGRMCAVIELR